MGYCPFLVLGHDTTDCIATQQGTGVHGQCGTTEQHAHDTAQQRCDTASHALNTADLHAGVSGSARARPCHWGVSRYKILYRDRGGPCVATRAAIRRPAPYDT